MSEKIDCPISVSFTYNHIQNKVYPRYVSWGKRTYKIIKVGFHYSYREGKTLYHIFSVISPTLFFKLRLDTETLAWRLEEVADV